MVEGVDRGICWAFGLVGQVEVWGAKLAITPYCMHYIRESGTPAVPRTNSLASSSTSASDLL